MRRGRGKMRQGRGKIRWWRGRSGTMKIDTGKNYENRWRYTQRKTTIEWGYDARNQYI